jgi:N-acetylneuraminic acid mutarotase
MQPAYGSDLSGALWLFGGRAYDPAGNFGGMNDLWKWNGTAWTWVRGSKHVAPFGTYGTKGVADGANTPGGRDTMAFATDCNGRLWIYGGSGYGATTAGELSDLWQFDGTNWVWLSGSDQAGTLPVHGTKGVADPANTPGGREQALAWIDADGTFWLFGGYGYDSTGKADHLNDLWKFDGSSWTWVSGSKIAEQPGVYGTLGIPAPDNLPGARSLSRGFADKSGNLWLFGGYGRDKNGDLLVLNDLWKFDGVAWTWMKGSDLTLQFGVYGTKGVAASDNTPGARFIHASAQDADGNFWVVGGDAGYQGYVNEVWKFDGVNWAWMAGSAAGSQPGVYGTLGVPSDSNHPGSRGHAACWFDTSGRFWLFGGEGFDASGSVLQMLNDMWRYDP